MVTSADRPLISVVIAVYNCVSYLAEAIESVLAQSYRPLELIVVDDGSDDGSGAIAKGFGSDLTYVFHPHVGMAAARNRAVELVNGSFLAFLDSDDRFTEDRLSRQMAQFEAGDGVDIVYGRVAEFVSPEIAPEAIRHLRQPFEPVLGRLPGTALIKLDAFLAVGMFDETLQAGIGLDWAARAQERELKSRELDSVVLERRLHLQNNRTRQPESGVFYLRAIKAALDRRRASLS
jgi:glycosyltransferase involved in cell wall biosynthesis